MSCNPSKKEKYFRVTMLLLAAFLIAYGMYSKRYGIGVLSIIPVLLVVYSECGSLPLLTCETDEDIKDDFRLETGRKT